MLRLTVSIRPWIAVIVVILSFVAWIIVEMTTTRCVVVDLSEELYVPGGQPIESKEMSYIPAKCFRRSEVMLVLNNAQCRIACDSGYVEFCGKTTKVHHLTLVTNALTVDGIAALHRTFAGLVDAPEQVVAFDELPDGGAITSLKVSKSDIRRMYYLGVHRSFKPAAPWFAEIVVTWSCD